MMPLAMVRENLACGDLVQLEFPDLSPFTYPLDAVYRADTQLGPAAV